MLHKITLFLFLIFYFDGNAQKIDKIKLKDELHYMSGSYYTIIFNENGRFEGFMTSSDISPTYEGKGNYFIRNDSLVLKYDNVPFFKNYHEIVNEKETLKDSATVFFKVLDNHTKEEITKYIAGDFDTQKGKSKHFYINELNYEGNYALTFKKSTTPVVIKIKSNLFSSKPNENFKYLFNFTPNSDKEIKIYATYKYAGAISNMQERFEIKRNKRKYLKLKFRVISSIKENIKTDGFKYNYKNRYINIKKFQ
jgi:hypothetical protein